MNVSELSTEEFLHLMREGEKTADSKKNVQKRKHRKKRFTKRKRSNNHGERRK